MIAETTTFSLANKTIDETPDWKKTIEDDWDQIENPVAIGEGSGDRISQDEDSHTGPTLDEDPVDKKQVNETSVTKHKTHRGGAQRRADRIRLERIARAEETRELNKHFAASSGMERYNVCKDFYRFNGGDISEMDLAARHIRREGAVAGSKIAKRAQHRANAIFNGVQS